MFASLGKVEKHRRLEATKEKIHLFAHTPKIQTDDKRFCNQEKIMQRIKVKKAGVFLHLKYIKQF